MESLKSLENESNAASAVAHPQQLTKFIQVATNPSHHIRSKQRLSTLVHEASDFEDMQLF